MKYYTVSATDNLSGHPYSETFTDKSEAQQTAQYLRDCKFKNIKITESEA